MIMIKKNQKILNRILILIDTFFIFISYLLAYYLRFESTLFEVKPNLGFDSYLVILCIIIPFYLILFNYFSLYKSYRISTIYQEVINLFKSYLLGIIIIMTVLFWFKEIHYSRLFLIIFFTVGFIFSILERVIIRLFLRYIRKSGYNLKHVLIVGVSELAERFIDEVNRHNYLGYSLIGLLADSVDKGMKINGLEVIGKINDLPDYFDKVEIDRVIITLSIDNYDKLGGIINICEDYGIRVKIIPDYNKYIPARPYVDLLGDLQLINIRHVPLDNLLNKYLKRIFDFIVSLLAIIVFSPIMITTSILIKLTSPGPLIFKQERIGEDGQAFEMYKFRSMIPHAEEIAATKWTEEDDPRKTKFGSFIRKISVDELPQLFNVLKGEMSLVGPRPERPFFVKKFKEEIPRYMVKHQVPPGITGWAQVNGWRGDTSIKKRIEYDIYYVENWNLFLDVKILWLTIFKGFRNENAY